MKKTPESDGTSAEAAVPVIPGTEEPRSLGDMMREAAMAAEPLAGSASSSDGQSATVQSDARPSTPAGSPTAKSSHTKPSHAKSSHTKSVKPKKVSRSQARRFARERALQALYQWDVSAAQASDVHKQFMTEQDMSRVDVDYFDKVFKGVSHGPQAIDDALADALDRPIDDLDPIERAVLRIAAFELTQCPDIPARVVINEGIEITKRFGADKGHRYVNGVLDKLAASVRPQEMLRR